MRFAYKQIKSQYRTVSRTFVSISIALSLISCGGVTTKTKRLSNAPQIQQSSTEVCLLAGALPPEFKYVEVARIAATKGTYGGTDEITRAIASEAKILGADVVLGLQANQRFKGPLPWRITSPTGKGTAVKLTPDSPKLNCESVGGIRQ